MSNATIPEAERKARGQARLQLRVNRTTVTALDALMAAAGRSDFVAMLIEAESIRAARRKRLPRP